MIEECKCKKFQSDEYLICFKHKIYSNMFAIEWKTFEIEEWREYDEK